MTPDCFSLFAFGSPIIIWFVTRDTDYHKKGVQPCLSGHPREMTDWPRHCAHVSSKAQTNAISSSSVRITVNDAYLVFSVMISLAWTKASVHRRFIITSKSSCWIPTSTTRTRWFVGWITIIFLASNNSFRLNFWYWMNIKSCIFVRDFLLYIDWM